MMAWATKSFHFKEFGETKWLEHHKSNLSTFLIQSILIMNLLCWIKGVLLLIINLDYIYCDSMWWNSETCKSPKGTVNTFYRHCGVLSVHSNNIISTLRDKINVQPPVWRCMCYTGYQAGEDGCDWFTVWVTDELWGERRLKQDRRDRSEKMSTITV